MLTKNECLFAKKAGEKTKRKIILMSEKNENYKPKKSAAQKII
jgi:hypothetical protein